MEESGRRFVVQRTLGQGSYGQVYLTEMESAGGFKRRVALKLLRPGWEPTSDAARRIRDEARILGRVDHQNIVRVEDLVQLDGRWAIVMEYIAGVDLESLANERIAADRMLPIQACLEVAAAIADACIAAWDAEGDDQKAMRVIHRDIKPSNVRLSMTGTVKVLDFGVARADIDDRAAITDGVRYGSIGYMAPERLHEDSEHPSGDVYSIGVVLYELVTLQAWGRADPRTDRHQAQIDAAAALIRERGGPAASDVAELLTRCLAYEPSERPTMAQLRDDALTLAMLAADGDLRSVARTVSAAVPTGTDDESGRVLVERTVAPRISGPTIVSGPAEVTRVLPAVTTSGTASSAGFTLEPSATERQEGAPRMLPLIATVAVVLAAAAVMVALVLPRLGTDAPVATTPATTAATPPATTAPPTPQPAPEVVAPPVASAVIPSPGSEAAVAPPVDTKPVAKVEPKVEAKAEPKAGPKAERTEKLDAGTAAKETPAATPDAPVSATPAATTPDVRRLRSAKFTVDSDAQLSVRCGDRSGSGAGNVLLRDLPAGACRVSAGGASTTVTLDSPRGVACTLSGGTLLCR